MCVSSLGGTLAHSTHNRGCSPKAHADSGTGLWGRFLGDSLGKQRKEAGTGVRLVSLRLALGGGLVSRQVLRDCMEGLHCVNRGKEVDIPTMM